MSFLFNKKEETLYEKITNSLGMKDTFIMSADKIVDFDIKPYWAQREKDEIHINTIANGIRTSNFLFHPIILSNIKETKEYSYLDGQHRIEALSRLSRTQRMNISIQVDVLNFEKDDDKWILQQYEYINTSKSMNKEELNIETKVSLIVDECTKQFKILQGGYKMIGDFAIKNKQNSRLNNVEFKKELIKRMSKLGDNSVKKIIEYNKICSERQDELFKKVRIGSRVREECVNRDFWLGINFPQWLDEVFV